MKIMVNFTKKLLIRCQISIFIVKYTLEMGQYLLEQLYHILGADISSEMSNKFFSVPVSFLSFVSFTFFSLPS